MASITRSNGATEKNLLDADLTNVIIGRAIEVHNHLGPGLLESVYETCLVHELTTVGLSVERQKLLPVRYKNLSLQDGLRIDVVVEGRVIVELKCVEKLMPVHDAQLYTYLKLSGVKTGLLINFFTKVLRDGIKRIVC
ncbi:GxxExxY protein [Geobacter benzoatilyticus]|jgi:GxxExxY protein|uniref:GxxExxY protein n=1 Tax=Geobacter benzoatilyticus TaxID=2815309 RepID=A0ABX7Q6K6_9BACT|nr:GxxExxY protein [Geobacter benzoatilyticus]QSV46501.1 GxxExxY protein [Geobacter benzoatilyticus]